MKEKNLYQTYHSTLTRRVLTLIILATATIILGVVGYMCLEKWSFLDALYMTVITLTTVGFSEIHPLSPQGKVFTVFLITSGVGTFTYGALSFSKLLIEGEFRVVLEKRRWERKMKKLKDHVILCGFGRLGEKVSEGLYQKHMPFVVIESNSERIEALKEKNYLHIQADSSEEEILEKAQVKEARTLIAVLGSDADNLFVTLTARELNPKIYIVARVEDPHTMRKLYKAGANRVISPYDVGASMLLHAALKPTVTDLIELTTRLGPVTLLLEEVIVEEGSPLDGTLLKDSKIREDTGAIVVAVRKGKDAAILRPEPDLKLERGDLLVVLGSTADIEKLQELSKSPLSL